MKSCEIWIDKDNILRIKMRYGQEMKFSRDDLPQGTKWLYRIASKAIVREVCLRRDTFDLLIHSPSQSPKPESTSGH